ncbi:MAG: DinB family protein [Chitinophagaceae bacterium]|nr:DinB family protein [Chitinophagaceae bacterium]
MWVAEEAWWKRHKLAENIVLESQKFDGSFAQLVNHLAQQSTHWKEWIDNCTETQLEHVFAYIRNKSEEKMPTYQMLLHLFNHATYHRGQLITMLRQLGADKIPATDFSAFCRLK